MAPLRHHFLVRRTDPFVVYFGSFLWCGAISKHDYEGKMAPLCQRGVVFQNGSSEAPFWLHLFSECSLILSILNDKQYILSYETMRKQAAISIVNRGCLGKIRVNTDSMVQSMSYEGRILYQLIFSLQWPACKDIHQKWKTHCNPNVAHKYLIFHDRNYVSGILSIL